MDPWNGFVQLLGPGLGPYVPRVMGAAALILLTWLAARLARSALLKLAASPAVSARLASSSLGTLVPLAAQLVFWLVWLLAMPALLDALALQGLLVPVNAMMARVLGALPGVMGAALIFGVGLIAARILRQVVVGVLVAAGSERLAARMGVGTALGASGLAGLAGSAVFALVLLPTLATALQTLGLEAVARPLGHLLDTVVELIPKLISAALVVAVGALLGRMLATLTTALMVGLGANELPARVGLDNGFRVGGRTLSELAGAVIMAAALLLAVTQAFEVLGFAVLMDAVAQLGGVLSRLVSAALILLAGLWLAALAGRAVAASSMPNAALLAQGARAAILFFALALALRQTGLPADIITIAFASVVGGSALAVAIAVGVGGRHVAQRLLEAAVASLQRGKGAAKTPVE